MVTVQISFYLNTCVKDVSKIALMFFFFILISVNAHTKTVCTITLESSEEAQVFRNYTTSSRESDLKWVELTTLGTSGNEPISKHWFQKACDSGIQCDSLLISAHFAGSFSGSKSPHFLNLNTLEAQACGSTCKGITDAPKEVYLMACNTMAGKDLDGRSSRYQNILVNHTANSPEDSVFIFNDRYGVFGYAFRDRFENIFSRANIIVGFRSASPLGKSLAGPMRNYLQQTVREYGSYSHYLEMVQSKDMRAHQETLALKQFSFGKNLAVIGQGLSQKAPGDNELRRNYCSLFDERIRIDERIRNFIIPALSGSASSVYKNISSIMGFFRSVQRPRNLDINECHEFRKLSGLVTLRELLLNYLDNSHQGQLSNLYNVEIAYLTYRLGWITSSDFLKKLEKMSILLLQEPLITKDGADMVCEMANDFVAQLRVTHFKTSKISASLLRSANGLRVMGCLNIQNPKFLAAVEKARVSKDADFVQVAEKIIWLRAQSTDKILGILSRDQCPPL